MAVMGRFCLFRPGRRNRSGKSTGNQITGNVTLSMSVNPVNTRQYMGREHAPSGEPSRHFTKPSVPSIYANRHGANKGRHDNFSKRESLRLSLSPDSRRACVPPRMSLLPVSRFATRYSGIDRLWQSPRPVPQTCQAARRVAGPGRARRV